MSSPFMHWVSLGAVTGGRITHWCAVCAPDIQWAPQAQKRAAEDEERRRVHKSALSARRSNSAASCDALPMPGLSASSGGGAAAGAWQT